MNDRALERLQPLRRRGPIVVFCLSLVGFLVLPLIAVSPAEPMFFDGSVLLAVMKASPPSPALGLICLGLALVLFALSILSFRRRKTAGSPGLTVAAVALAGAAALEQVLILLVFYTSAAGLYS